MRRLVDANTLPAALSERNWISFAEDASFDTAFGTLVEALEHAAWVSHRQEDRQIGR